MSLRAAHGQPLIIAHRGHSVGAPEQTIAAFEMAAEFGADMIEADVGRTRDGQLVLLHDATLDRTTNARGALVDVPFTELRQYDAGSWFDVEFSGQRVPSLDELFDLAERWKIGLCLEAKGHSAEERFVIALSVAHEMADRDRLHRDVLASFDHGALFAASKNVPGLRTAPDRLPERGPSTGRDLVEQARRLGAEVIQHHHADLLPQTVDEVHAAGLAIWAWPTTTGGEIRRAIALGVDGLMGDDVAAIAALLEEERRASADGHRPS